MRSIYGMLVELFSYSLLIKMRSMCGGCEVVKSLLAADMLRHYY